MHSETEGGGGAPGPAGRRSNGYPRQADIARLAGVSQATVSMVINDRDATRHRIGQETRKRVWDAVEQLGYVGNPAARVLAGGRSQLVGIYTFEPVFPVDFRDFYYPFLLGIEEEAEEQGYNLLLFTSAGGPGRERRIYRDGANQLRVADGCVLLGRGGDHDELERLTREPFPVVFIGRRELGGERCAYVGADYVGATAAIVDHLAGLGHERIAYLGWADHDEPTLDRRRGYEQAMARRLGHAPDPRLVHQLPESQITAELVADLLAGGATAVIAQDDEVADRIAAHAEAAGRVIPDDLSIAVLGDPPRGGPSSRDWTGFVIPRREMGRNALRVLVELLDRPDQPAPHLLLPCTLHPGATAAAPATP